jgi:anti-sigma regulatory factor (Ser/Thr protein kinase)
MMDRAGPFELKLAADASLIVTARLFASDLARQMGCDEGTVDDVKLAVSEGCTAVLSRAHSEPILVVAERAEDGLTFSISPIARGVADGPASGESSLPQGVELIELIFEDTEVLGDTESGAVRFTVPDPVT